MLNSAVYRHLDRIGFPLTTQSPVRPVEPGITWPDSNLRQLELGCSGQRETPSVLAGADTAGAERRWSVAPADLEDPRTQTADAGEEHCNDVDVASMAQGGPSAMVYLGRTDRKHAV
ncbi:hypothetical protein AAFF_G00025990 [Aldrovandia affinis]|uniref:Uncharacterized protein n=1 Tax=Aldrovandia affinis TaxID=143900 RepID=A0AAD7S5F2_9TELE|nr:hypothetical protein AAFF_G00025990 [Aldrovandia affinis]